MMAAIFERYKKNCEWKENREYDLKENNQKKATEHFKIAYEMTEEQKDGWLNYPRYLYLENKLALEQQ